LGVSPPKKKEDRRFPFCREALNGDGPASTGEEAQTFADIRLLLIEWMGMADETDCFCLVTSAEIDVLDGEF
jgi:hypothetical protein